MKEEKDIFDHLKPRKTPVPDASYFENLANSVIESQKETPVKKQAPVIPLYRRPVVWIGAVAAIFIAGILIINLSSSSENNADPLLALSDVSQQDVYHYIDENIEDFETDLIVEALNESDVDEMNFIEQETTESSETETEKTTPETISWDEIETEDILEYFNDEGIDTEDFDDDSFI